MNPFRAALVGLFALGVLIGVVAALTGLLVVFALVVALGALNLIYLPRLARQLRISAGWLAMALFPVMLLIGGLAGGVEGAGWAAGVWVVAVGLPRAIGFELARRVRRRIAASQPYFDVPSRVVVDRDVMTPTGRPAGRPLPPEAGPGRGESGP